MKKIVMLFFIILIFSSCKTLQLDTSYGYRVDSKEKKEIQKKIAIGAIIMDDSKKEKSSLTYISINTRDKNNNIKETSKKIKIISNGKEYFINVSPENNTYYPVYNSGVIIDSDEFILELGKIKFDNDTILNIPPLLFEKKIYIYKYNMILDTLNQHTNNEEIFKGTIEEYREWKKKNK